jgi:hypothetical protein
MRDALVLDVIFLTHAVGARSVGFERAAHRSQARAADAADVRLLCRGVRLEPEGRRRGGRAGLGAGLACWNAVQGGGVSGGALQGLMWRSAGVGRGVATHLTFFKGGSCVQQHHHQATIWQWPPHERFVSAWRAELRSVESEAWSLSTLSWWLCGGEGA